MPRLSSHSSSVSTPIFDETPFIGLTDEFERFLEDPFRGTKRAREAEAEKIVNDFILKVPSLIRGTEDVSQKRSEDPRIQKSVKTVKRQIM
ncbi:hypothetical protein DPMN_160107 [Dreissena polymorpha]|uniref:Uncharacterized protein n=1 Tax=Dreissena polymorpha TaxID=45954 RepID=A0A9D4IPT4_DREPO|nr:hypothetical protein DPMN_160107 [Dreissena polymorpha]